MARSYSKYLYETSPRKLEPSYTPKKRTKDTIKQNESITRNLKKQRQENKLKFKIMMY